MKYKILLYLFFSFYLTSTCWAGIYHFSGFKRGLNGWYWYEFNIKKEKRHKKIEKSLTYKQLWNMPPDKFQSLLKRALNLAVQDPTPKNVKRYLILQDIALKKATAFAAVAEYVYQTNPELSNADVYPIAAPGRVAMVRMQEQEVRETIERNKKDFALILFYRNDCPFCKAQFAILRYFQNKYGWNIKPIDIDKSPNTASVLGIREVPTIILIHRGDKKYITISVGLVAVSELEIRIYRGIRLLLGRIKPQQWLLYRYERGTAEDPLAYIKR